MYTDFFQLREEPFQVTPNPKYLFLSSVHRAAVQKLSDGIRRRKGFLTMIGEAGTGKTLLCKELIQMLSTEMDIAYLFFPVLNEQTLYHAILKQWRQDLPGEAEASLMIERIHAFLKGRFERGRNALIILDEAQNLSLSLLENLRLLSNLETESEKLLQILLTGQPEFHTLLRSGKIPQLDQRIRVRVFLEPLDRETLPLYVYHRLNTAGGMGSLEFTEDAFDLIHTLSGGIPRVINTLCEQALEEAYLRKTHRIDRPLLQSVQKEKKAATSEHRRTHRDLVTRFTRTYRLTLGLLIALFLGVVLWLMPTSFHHPRGNNHPVHLAWHKIQRGKIAAVLPAVHPHPLPKMRSFLAGFLALPPNSRPYWGGMRLRQRDLIGLATPVLLHVILHNGVEGWIYARSFHAEGYQIWSRGEWEQAGPSFLSAWTGRCEIPFWFEDPTWDKRPLRLGKMGSHVITLQHWLTTLGLLKRETGLFDETTRKALKRFQMKEGLYPDGVAGLQTLALLFQKALAKKTRKGESLAQ